MEFCWVTINVKNMAESLSFYQEIVGLKVNRKMNPVPEIEIAFLGTETSETEIELIKNKNTASAHCDGVSLGFTVESLDKTIDMLKKKKIEELEGPFQPTPKIRFLYIKDPNGIKIQFVENIK